MNRKKKYGVYIVMLSSKQHWITLKISHRLQTGREYMQQNLILIHLIYLAILINLFFIQENMCDHDHPSNYSKSVLAQKQ